jgi:hypothetical protein
MSPKQLANLLTSMGIVADVVDAIDDRDLQERRAWDLSGWHYELVHWGVRFRCVPRKSSGEAEVLAVLGHPGPGGTIRHADRREVGMPASFVVML